MAIETLFSGNALRAVDAEGRTALPPFIVHVLERRGAAARVVLGSHESDPCISGYDEGYGVVLYAETERRRLRDEAGGTAPAAHHSRLRRTFGAAEPSSYDSRGRVRLPPLMRRKCRIDDLALFIGTGGSFEIWDPRVAREAGDRELRELAEFAFLQNAINDESEVER